MLTNETGCHIFSSKTIFSTIVEKALYNENITKSTPIFEGHHFLRNGKKRDRQIKTLIFFLSFFIDS
jgi:hypothetical protein